LVKKVDPQGDTVCFGYDALHRNTSITYSGGYASVTPNKYFVYDSAAVNGVAMTNVIGRLAEAYTGSSSSKIADLGLSYTVRGEVSDTYQSTPHSGGYYHLTQTYWPHGAPAQLSGVPGLPTLTYGGTIGSTVGLDGEGRLTQVTASSGQNPVTGVNYNLYGTPPQTMVTFGSGDSDVFSYDANTFRLTKYQFNVGTGGQSSTGTLTWSANSTLQQLGINDQFNSADNQTCTYGYDDLVRITSANCGSVWSQTFSFDPFGNITKNGSGMFQPNYSMTRNRISSVGSTNATYDNNGSSTYDTIHNYAWDADGNSITVDTVGVTYDALDRPVEQNRSGAYTEIVYAPTGDKLALMSGQALQKAFVALPGGATAVYVSSGLDHYRHSDWLGSARLTSSPSRTVLSTAAYAPFGENYAQSGTADLSFTGQDQDTVSGVYDFDTREYNAAQGRWPSPDKAGLVAVDLTNPQSFNRYAYALNNPLSIVDPSGMCGDDFEDDYDASCGPDGIGGGGAFGFGAGPGPGNPAAPGVPGTGPPLGVFTIVDCLIAADQGFGNMMDCLAGFPAGTTNMIVQGGGGGGKTSASKTSASKPTCSPPTSKIPTTLGLSAGGTVASTAPNGSTSTATSSTTLVASTSGAVGLLANVGAQNLPSAAPPGEATARGQFVGAGYQVVISNLQPSQLAKPATSYQVSLNAVIFGGTVSYSRYLNGGYKIGFTPWPEMPFAFGIGGFEKANVPQSTMGLTTGCQDY
jgi:RHS repeat-associated protein